MKKIYALALAAVLAVSMNAFAGTGSKSCNKPQSKSCELKDDHCKESDHCDKAKCEKTCDKKHDTKSEKKDS